MNYKNFKVLDLNLIAEDEKITLVKVSEFGFTQNIQMKFKKMFFKDYAQYKDCILIQGRLPRKRKDSAFLIRPNQEFVIYKGFIEIDDMVKTTKQDNGVVIKELGMCFDEDRFIQQNNNDLEKIYNTLEM